MVLGKKLILGLFIFCFHTVVALQQPLNILFVVDYFPAPSQVFILNIITGLIDNGHNVSIFSFTRKKPDGRPNHPNIAKYSLMDFVIYEEMPEQLPEVDIVFCQDASLGKRFLAQEALLPWLKERKLAVALRGNDITNNQGKENPTEYDLLFKETDVFLPVCDYFKQVAIQLGCQEDKIEVCHSAIDCDQFFFRIRKRRKKKGDPIELVSVCRLVEKKGLEFALQAVASLAKQYKNIHFTIVGVGRLEARLKKLAQSLGIAKRVTFFGWATHEQVVKILDKAHIFLLPSVTAENGDEEGIPNAVKEAMAMGLICLATNHAGIPELIDNGVSGFLVAQKSVKQLVGSVKYIIQHPERWGAVALAARKKIEKEFETKQSIKKLERIFYKLLARG